MFLPKNCLEEKAFRQFIKKYLKESYDLRIIISTNEAFYTMALYLNKTELRMLLYLISHLNGYKADVRQSLISKDLNIHIATVKKALKSLEKKGFIEIHKNGNRNIYHIAPYMFFEGATDLGFILNVLPKFDFYSDKVEKGIDTFEKFFHTNQ